MSPAHPRTEETGFRMPAEAALAALTFRVGDLDAQVRYYGGALGLRVLQRNDDGAVLSPADGAFTVTLLSSPGAPIRPPRTIGLYHAALLLPDRRALAAVVRRLMAEGRPPHGASDHGVSEAFYLHDAERNGLELYCDRPREQWPRQAGAVAMSTVALDVDDLLDASQAAGPLDAATRIGHLHLHVPSLEEGERFYTSVLGLDVMQRSRPGAVFMAVGGYHHHVGVNVWAQGRRAPEDATGLLSYTWRVPGGTVARLRAHLETIGTRFDADGRGGLSVRDVAGVIAHVAES